MKGTHGGYRELSKRNKHGLDLRTKQDKALKAFMDGVIADCGGHEAVDNFQLGMLDRACEALIVLRAMSSYAKAHGIVEVESGELIPCLRTSFVAYSNCFRWSLAEVYNRAGVKKKPPDIYEATRSEFFEEQSE